MRTRPTAVTTLIMTTTLTMTTTITITRTMTTRTEAKTPIMTMPMTRLTMWTTTPIPTTTQAGYRPRHGKLLHACHKGSSQTATLQTNTSNTTAA